MSLSVPYYLQQNEYSCAVAVLRSVFHFWGMNQSEKELQKLLRPTPERGISHKMLVYVSRKAGLHCKTQTHASLDSIKKEISLGRPVVINYIEPEGNEGHYAIVVDLSKNHIILNDPWHGEGFKLATKEFIKRWRNHQGTSRRWMLVIYPS